MTTIAFIGGGNMASAIIGGLLRQGMTPDNVLVLEPFEAARQKLRADFGLDALSHAGPALERAGMVIWAVKPQTFKDAAASVKVHVKDALHLSVAAGIRSDSIAHWTGSQRIVRSMPNTPALIGKGITALYGRPGVSQADRDWVTTVLSTTGVSLWLDAEEKLDAVTALSGSGPAYMFYFMEAMTEAGCRMGLDAAQAYQLAVATTIGAGELARASSESAATLRERVTSKGGTTYAALTAMESSQIKTHFIDAMLKAGQRARELGDEFGS